MFNLVMNMVNESNHFRESFMECLIKSTWNAVLVAVLPLLACGTAAQIGNTPSKNRCYDSIHPSHSLLNQSCCYQKPTSIIKRTPQHRLTRLGFHLGFRGLGRKGREWLHSQASAATGDEGECQQLARHYRKAAAAHRTPQNSKIQLLTKQLYTYRIWTHISSIL